VIVNDLFKTGITEIMEIKHKNIVAISSHNVISFWDFSDVMLLFTLHAEHVLR
jgi:hypothetical protein